MNAVLTFKISVNKITEIPSELVTTIARFKLCLPSSDPPTITGKSEIVHGARTVNTPANSDKRKSIIDTYNITINGNVTLKNPSKLVKIKMCELYVL